MCCFRNSVVTAIFLASAVQSLDAIRFATDTSRPGLDKFETATRKELYTVLKMLRNPVDNESAGSPSTKKHNLGTPSVYCGHALKFLQELLDKCHTFHEHG